MRREELDTSYEEILTWPRTPTTERLKTALLTLNQLTRAGEAAKMAQAIERMTGTDRDDIEAMLIITANFRFNTSGNDAILAMNINPDNNAELAEAVAVIASGGHSEQTIGIGVCIEEPNPSGMMRGTAFAQINRNPEWMGYCPLFKLVKNKVGVLFAAEDNPGTPAVATALPVTMVQTIDSDTVFPTGQATWLKELLLHHGALRCIWKGLQP